MTRMTKSELIARLAARNPHLYQRDVERIVATVFDQISTTVSASPRKGNDGATGRLRETKDSLRTSLTTADMAPIEIDKNFIGRSGISDGGQLQ